MNARTRIFRYVTFDNIDAYLALGWHFDGEPAVTMPGTFDAYRVVLEWLCDCHVIEPRRTP